MMEPGGTDPEKHRISSKTGEPRDVVVNRHGKEKCQPTRLSRTRGCMLGGAVGDALGAPVKFLGLDEIRRVHGNPGIARFAAAYGRRGAITDDTQMALFTAEGLILSRVRQEYAHGDLAITAIYHAYLRWLFTMGLRRSPENGCPISRCGM